MDIPTLALLFAFNLALASLLCLGLSLLASKGFPSLPKQHAILVAGMIACLFSPVVVFVGWCWPLGQLPAMQPSFFTATVPINETQRNASDEPILTRGDSQSKPLEPATDATVPNVPATSMESLRRIDLDQVAFESNESENRKGPHASQGNLLKFLGLIAVALWFLGSLSYAGKGIQSWRLAQRFLCNCLRHRDPQCQKTFALAAQRLRLESVPPLLESASLPAPIVVGLIRPAVIIPSNAAELFTPVQLGSVLTHELAHVARRDTWVAGLQAWLTVLYWWNPLTWIVCRKVAELRELVCDDIAVSLHPKPRDYARSIIAMAERAVSNQGSIVSLGISMSKASELERRIRRIISDRSPRLETRLTWQSLVGVASFVSFLTLGGMMAQVPSNLPSPVGELVSVKLNDDKLSKDGFGKTNAPAHHLSGQVILSDGHPAPAAKIGVRGHKNSGLAATIVADQYGKFDFEIQIESGALDSVQIWAEDNQGREIAFHRFAMESMKRVTEGMQIKLSLPRIVEVEVVDQNNVPIEGAKVALQLEYPHVADGYATDRSGRARVRVPELSKIVSVVAWKDHKGLDYRLYRLNREQKADLNAVAPEFPRDRPERLVLSGAKPIKVKVTENGIDTVAGVELIPFLLKSSKESDNLNLSLFHQTFAQESGQHGETTFAWMPAWHREQMIFFPNDKRFEAARGEYNPITGNGSLTMELKRLVPIRGRVLDSQGNPAQGIQISAVGSGRTSDSFSAKSLTDEKGNYEIRVASNHAYIVIAKGNGLAAPAHTGFVVFPEKPLSGMDFQLRKATRLYGKLLHDQTQQLLPNQQLLVVQNGISLDDIPDVEVPNPNQDPFKTHPMFSHFVSTNASGEFSIDLGDGNYSISAPQSQKFQKVDIAGEKEIELDILSTVGPEVELLGLVLGDDQKPMEGIRLRGIPQTILGKEWQATTDKEGKFRVRRKDDPTYVHGYSADKSLAGIQEVADNKGFVMHLLTTGKARGRLLNKDLDPIVGQQIDYGVEVRGPRRTFSIQFGGQVFTDSKGEFELEGLVPNWNYNLSLPVKNKALPKIATVTVKPGESLEIGELIAPSR